MMVIAVNPACGSGLPPKSLGSDSFPEEIFLMIRSGFATVVKRVAF